MAKKTVAYELIRLDSPAGEVMYPLLQELVEDHHEELTNARIALAWNRSWKADADGIRKLGQCKKASDLDRELAPYDFVIILLQEFYEDARVNDMQRRALIDHELCHAAVKLDKDGEPEEDEKGRKVYRTRKHDVEEFSEIVRRYGTWKRDLELFAQSLQASKQRDLPLDADAGTTRAVRDLVAAIVPPGVDSVSFTTPGHDPVTITREDAERIRRH